MCAELTQPDDHIARFLPARGFSGLWHSFVHLRFATIGLFPRRGNRLGEVA